MSRDVAEAFPEAMELWKLAERKSKISLREIYWDGDEAAMSLTRNLQPALVAANMALWLALSKYLSPACAAGHSLGEYNALAAARVLSPEHVFDLVSLRGRLMEEADPKGAGAMAAIVKLSLGEVEECVAQATARLGDGETLVIANYNTPAQFVVSGTKKAIDAILEPVKERKGRAIPLAVSGAFHSPLMAEASRELEKALDSLGKGAWNHARFPVYSNATAKAATDCEALKASLKKQMTSSVFWIPTMENMWDAGISSFVECGPKGVLTKMVGQILKERAASPSASAEGAFGDCENAPARELSAEGLGSLEQIIEFKVKNAS